MFLNYIFLFYLCIASCEANVTDCPMKNKTTFDYYSGRPASSELLKYYEDIDQTSTCTTVIEECDETERRRLDGSCNNLKEPARGTHSSPMDRLLDAKFYNGSFERKAVSGEDLPEGRKVRLEMLSTGAGSCHPDFNLNIPGFGIFMYLDTGSIHDTKNLIATTTYCCQPEHMTDYACTPNIVSAEDPVHKWSGIRCLNMTRSLYYQTYNCTKDPVPSPFSQATAALDVSSVYNAYNDGNCIRTNSSGKIIVEEEDDKLWPPNGPRGTCPINDAAKNQTRCFNNHVNGNVWTTFFTVWFVRQHNLIAEQLASLNPCWNDETIFQTSRDIIIAFTMEMYVCEWIDALVGSENLLKAGFNCSNPGYEDMYDDALYPVVLLEYAYALRWFHLILQGTSKLYNNKGEYIGSYPFFKTSFAPGLLAQNNNAEYFTQSTMRQCANGDNGIIVYETGDDAFPGLQLAMDMCASDVRRSRTFGLPGYVEYVYSFFGINITTWEQLAERINKTHVSKLQNVYDDPRDIDLMPGLWVEPYIEGGRVPETLAYILLKNLKRNVKGDRHWYKRRNRPHAFTEEQLLEINKASLALLLCNVGDNVTEVQRKAFLNISPENPLVDCGSIPKMNLTVWTDSTCNNS